MITAEAFQPINELSVRFRSKSFMGNVVYVADLFPILHRNELALVFLSHGINF